MARDRVNVVEGGALDPIAVQKAIPDETVAVISALGHTRNSPFDLETRALKNIVGSMQRTGVRRLVVLASAVVVEPSDSPTQSQRFVRWLTRVFRREVYEDSLAKATVVRDSGLDWTIVRALLLSGANATGRYHVGSLGTGLGVRVARGDVAEFMLSCATEGRYIGESPYISA